MNGTQLLARSKLFLKRQSPTILTCIGAVGVVATAVLAIRATPKAMETLERAKLEKEEDLTPLEVVQVAGPAYIPAITIGASTIACIFGANVLNKRQQATITGAYMFLQQSYKEYKNKVNEIFGKDADSQIKSAILEEKRRKVELPTSGETVLFYEEHYGEIFERTMAEVMDAEYQLNRKFAVEGEATLNDFFELLGLPKNDAGDSFGWNIDYICDFYSYSWIDFEHELVTLDDGLECYIITAKAGPVGEYLPL